MTTSVWTDWSTVAAGWDRFRVDIETTERDVTARLLDGLALSGRRVLELGAATGELAARLAEDVAPHGSVLASDAAEGMVQLLRGRLSGRSDVEVARIDALEIGLPEHCVDVVVFRMGLMLTGDPDRALVQIRRVVRSGGQVAVAVWGPPMANPWLSTVGMALMANGLVQGGPPVRPGEPFSLSDGDDLARRFRDAGFADVTVEAVESVRHYPDPDQHFAMVRSMAPPLAAALDAATPEQVSAVRATLDTLTAPYRTSDGLRLPSSAWVAHARA